MHWNGVSPKWPHSTTHATPKADSGYVSSGRIGWRLEKPLQSLQDGCSGEPSAPPSWRHLPRMCLKWWQSPTSRHSVFSSPRLWDGDSYRLDYSFTSPWCPVATGIRRLLPPGLARPFPAASRALSPVGMLPIPPSVSQSTADTI